MPGALILVGTPIGNLGDLSPRAAAALAAADVIACEDTRHSRKLLTAAGIHGKRMVALHEHNEARGAAEMVERVRRGERVVLISDAGMPAVSDPGQRVVAAVAGEGLPVEVVPGPSAVVSALVVSGLPTDRFCFEGFLPRKGKERAARLAELAAEPRTSVVFEAPARVAATLADLADACGADRRVAVARELTKVFEEVWRGTVGDAAHRWQGTSPPGEHVIVLDGAPRVTVTDDDVLAALQERLASGEDRKSAVSSVASDLGVSKNRVYDLSLAQKASTSPGRAPAGG